MNIKSEFKKMIDTTTDPMQYLMENVEDNYIDAEIVEPDPVPDVYIPKSITGPTPLQQLISAWHRVPDSTKLEFTKKLLAKYLSQPESREGFKDLLRSNGLIIESVIMPQENVEAPEPVVGESENVVEPEKDFRTKVEDLKNEIEAKKGSGTPEEEKAWDDITSAFDLIAHHLDDITEDEQAPEADNPRTGIQEIYPAI